MRVLVDTSIWSIALGRANHVVGPEVADLRRLITEHLIEIIGPIRQEILSGVREHSQFERLESNLQPFPDAPILTEDYVTAAKLFNLCRSKGIQGSNTDFLMCAVAARSDCAIFTTDSDFVLFAEHLPIILHEIGKRVEPRATPLLRARRRARSR